MRSAPTTWAKPFNCCEVSGPPRCEVGVQLALCGSAQRPASSCVRRPVVHGCTTILPHWRENAADHRLKLNRSGVPNLIACNLSEAPAAVRAVEAAHRRRFCLPAHRGQQASCNALSFADSGLRSRQSRGADIPPLVRGRCFCSIQCIQHDAPPLLSAHLLFCAPYEGVAMGPYQGNEGR